MAKTLPDWAKPDQLEVLSPEEASGTNTDAAIVLGAHRRYVNETVWHNGHQAQANRRYVALSRQSMRLYLIVEGPEPKQTVKLHDD